MAALALLASAPSPAQDKAQDKQDKNEAKVNLELIAAPVKPGEPVFVNVMLTNPGGERVRVVHETLQFPREKMAFTSARLGIAGDLGDATLALIMKDKTGARTSNKEAAQSLDVTISAKQTMPDGPLIEFEFRLTDTKEQSIKLPHTAEVMDDQGKKIAGVKFTDAQLVVSESTSGPPSAAIGCFFFTH
jgi:hypothetical protein